MATELHEKLDKLLAYTERQDKLLDEIDTLGYLILKVLVRIVCVGIVLLIAGIFYLRYWY